jgi:hypothetical protein
MRNLVVNIKIVPDSGNSEYDYLQISNPFIHKDLVGEFFTNGKYWGYPIASAATLQAERTQLFLKGREDYKSDPNEYSEIKIGRDVSMILASVIFQNLLVADVQKTNEVEKLSKLTYQGEEISFYSETQIKLISLIQHGKSNLLKRQFKRV